MSRDVTDGATVRWRRVLAGLAAGACSSLLIAPPLASAAPDGRAYEMVSPPQKYQGGVVFGQRASRDGNAVGFVMNSAAGSDSAAYAIAPYVAYRTSDGWVTKPGAPMINSEWRGASNVKVWVHHFNEDFTSLLLYTSDRYDPDDKEVPAGDDVDGGFDYYRYSVDTRATKWLTRPAPSLLDAYLPGSSVAIQPWAAASRDGRHLVFLTTRVMVEDDGVPATGTKIYESVDGALRLVSVLPDGRPSRRTGTPFPYVGYVDSPHQVRTMSDDGSRIFFYGGTGGLNRYLYVRENGERTLLLSGSRRADDPGRAVNATFLDASSDGSVAYFTSTGILTDDASGGLYRWERDGETLRFVAPGTSVDDARASADASRLYFTSTSAWTADAVPFERNIYLYEEGQPIQLVATTSTTLPANDPGLVISDDGRYAVFSSQRSLDPRVRDGINALYRYDAETRELVCVSCRTDGRVATRHSRFKADRARYSAMVSSVVVAPRYLTDDGDVYFESDEALVPEDVNGAVDVYGFEDGRVTLISSGRGAGSEYVDNSADGRSVFFTTPEKLVAQDIDGGYPDVYVARVGGGFPEPPPAPQLCQGDTCQGPISLPPVFDPPGSTQVTPSDEGDDPAPTTVGFRPLRPTRAQLRSFAARGRIVLKVRVTARGSVLVAARGRIGRRQRSLGQGWTTATRRGTVRVTVPLNRLAIRQLVARKTLRVTLTVRHSGADEARQLTLRLKRPARATGVRR